MKSPAEYLAESKARKSRRALKRATLAQGRPKLKSRKWLIRELDAELSRQVRTEKTMCAFCPKPAEHCFHFLTRKNFSTRWERQNVTASCAGCNIRYEHDADFVHQVVDRFRQTYGAPAWEDLVRRHHQPTKFSRSDLAALLEKLKTEKQ